MSVVTKRRTKSDMAKRERLFIGELGEYYNDLLTVDSAINNRTAPSQANALLCSKLQERESRVKERVQYLADKRGISFKEMWNQLLTGNYQKLNPEEYAEWLAMETADGE